MPEPGSIRWGIVGTSGWAASTFGPAVSSCADVTLLGAAGSRAEGSEEFAARLGAPRTYRDIDALLADPDVDAVWIASPNHLHRDHGVAALEAGTRNCTGWSVVGLVCRAARLRSCDLGAVWRRMAWRAMGCTG